MTSIRDYEVTPEMKELGFSRIYKKDKNLVIYNSPALITSKYFPGDLDSTLHHLEKALTEYDKRNNNHFGSEKIERFIRWFAETDIKTDEAEDEAAKQIKIQENIEKNKIIKQIEELKAEHAGMSSEHWRIGLVRRFDTLRTVVHNNIPELWPGLEFELSGMRILNIRGVTLPLIGIILGRAGGGKTQNISLLRKWPYSYYTDNFSPKAWVSHSTAVKEKEDLEAIDLLPRIKNKIFCTPEFAPVFTSKEDDLRLILGLVTRIADGQGLSSHSGVYGLRAYEGTHMFVWIGAAVDVPHIVYKVLASLGPKLYFFRLPYRDIAATDIVKDIGADFNIKFDSIQTALFDYLRWFEIDPDLTFDDSDGEGSDDYDDTGGKDLRFKPDGSNNFKFHDDDDIIFNEMMRKKKSKAERKQITGPRLSKITWDADKDIQQAKKCISELAKLLSHLRCDVKTWTEGSEYGYSPSLPEHPKRASDVLFNLARGHALLYGRNYVTMEDIPITVKTVLSTAQVERVSILSLLLANNGKWLSTSRIIESLTISPPTVRRRMMEFKAIGLVDEEYSGSSHEKSIKLKKEFDWFLGDEFKQLRDGFEPADYHADLDEESLKGKSVHTTDYSSAYERIVIFDRVFDELASRHTPFAMEVDKGTVGRYELQQALVSTGKFFQNDALVIIDDMMRLEKITIVMTDTYRKKYKENDSQ